MISTTKKPHKQPPNYLFSGIEEALSYMGTCPLCNNNLTLNFDYKINHYSTNYKTIEIVYRDFNPYVDFDKDKNISLLFDLNSNKLINYTTEYNTHISLIACCCVDYCRSYDSSFSFRIAKPITVFNYNNSPNYSISLDKEMLSHKINNKLYYIVSYYAENKTIISSDYFCNSMIFDLVNINYGELDKNFDRYVKLQAFK